MEVAIRDHVGRATSSHPSRVVIESDHTAKSLHEPLARHHFVVERDATTVSVRTTSAPTLDLEPVRAFWRSHLGIGAWPGEELTLALIERFVRRVRIVDPDGFAKIHGRSALFLANHQVGIESLLFGITISALNGLTSLTLAKAEHTETWLGKLITHLFSYPGLRDPRVIAYFDRADPASLPRILGELGAMMKGAGKNVTIHVEGTRALRGAQPVAKMSGVFVDMALELGCPIVPVRFAGGLPRHELEGRLELPFAMGRQDYIVGAPIEPADLAALPYKDRTGRVIAAINALLDPDESPLDPDPAFERAVHDHQSRTGALEPHAAIYRTLADRPDLGRELTHLVRGALRAGPSPRDAWLIELAQRLAPRR
jgi:1-acyl-sn-glycerol-3-phosphate acyltransferase